MRRALLLVAFAAMVATGCDSVLMRHALVPPQEYVWEFENLSNLLNNSETFGPIEPLPPIDPIFGCEDTCLHVTYDRIHGGLQ